MMGSRRAIRFQSEDETSAFAVALAPGLAAGDTILLQGDLGAGKTHFARALIQARLAGAGLAEDIPSPTFTLVQTYFDGGTEIWHCDLYRMGGPEEVAELGLDDAFTDAICLVEWPDRLGDTAPDTALILTFAHATDPNVRDLTCEWRSDRWANLLDAALPGTSE